MIYLILAIVSSALVSLTMRLSQRHVRNNISMLACNYVMCALLSAAFSGTTDFFPAQAGLGAAVVLGVISGALYLGSFVLLQWNIRVNGVVLPATFMKLGVLVPTLLSIILFHETPGAAQVLGMIGAIAAIVLIQLEKGQSRAKNGAGLIVLLLGGGITDSMSKFYEQWGSSALENHYLLYTFAVALLLCVGLSVLKGQRLTLADMGYGLLVGVPNYFSARFLLLSLSGVPAVVAYPTYSVGTIVTVALAGAAFFGERLSRRQIAAMGLILVSLALLNL